jgi:cytochrome c553
MSRTVTQDNGEALDRDLRTLRARLPDLRQIAAKKASVMARRSRGGQRTVAPIPLNEGAWQLVQDIERFAWSVGRAVGVRQAHVPAEGLLAAAIGHVDRLLARPDAGLVQRVAATLVERLDRQFTPPEDRTLIGYCTGCGAELWADDDDIASGWAVCSSCHATLKVRDIQQARILRLAASGAQGTAASLAKLLKSCGVQVRRQTIAQWKLRGIVKPVGEQDGKPVYLLWDIWQACTRQV